MRSMLPVLLVDDDRVDVMSVQRAFRDLKIANHLETCGDGEEALARLRQSDKPRPCLVLLDLKMPRMDGIELLRAMKQDPELRSLPVVMMTTSHEESDRVRSFDLGAAGYVVKPIDYKQFVDAIRTIDLYWTLSQTTE